MYLKSKHEKKHRYAEKSGQKLSFCRSLPCVIAGWHTRQESNPHRHLELEFTIKPVVWLKRCAIMKNTPETCNFVFKDAASYRENSAEDLRCWLKRELKEIINKPRPPK